MFFPWSHFSPFMALNLGTLFTISREYNILGERSGYLLFFQEKQKHENPITFRIGWIMLRLQVPPEIPGIIKKKVYYFCSSTYSSQISEILFSLGFKLKEVTLFNHVSTAEGREDRKYLIDTLLCLDPYHPASVYVAHWLQLVTAAPKFQECGLLYVKKIRGEPDIGDNQKCLTHTHTYTHIPTIYMKLLRLRKSEVKRKDWTQKKSLSMDTQWIQNNQNRIKTLTICSVKKNAKSYSALNYLIFFNNLL